MAGWTLAGLVAAAVTAADAPVNVLLLKAHHTLDARVVALLAQAGIRVLQRPVSQPLSMDMLRQFHVVALADAGALEVGFFRHDFLEKYYALQSHIRLLHAYVAAGGGLYFQPLMGGAGMATSQAYRPLLDAWAVRILAGQVRDDAKAVPVAQGEPAFSWTETIARHPVTEGVRRVYFPTNMLRWDDAYSTNPLELADPAWEVIVRGSDTSTAARGFQYTTWMPLPGGRSPAIAAVRQAGRGRVAVLGIHSFYTLFYPDYRQSDWIGESHTGVIDGRVLDKGDGRVPSDVGRLLVNILRWLAEPARAAGLGTYTPETFARLPEPARPTVPAWLGPWRPTPGATWFRVLVGARTAYSDGTGTVAELAQAARQAGYAVLALTETFERFRPDDWPRLLADGDQATDQRLVVLAGLDLPDAYGNRFLLFGQSRYPDAFMLTDDGRAMRWTQNLMLGFSQHMAAVGRPGSTPLPHPLYKHYSGIALATWRDGQLIDNGWPAYAWQASQLSWPLPLAVHEVYSPAQVAAAAATGHQLLVLADTPANAAWYLRHGHEHFFEDTPHFQVTAGPVITALSFAGTRASFQVESDVPLAEVRLVTNGVLTRRWLPPQGQTKFSATAHLGRPPLEGNILVVTDVQGRTAYSAVGSTGAAAGYRNRCSDHQNWIGFRHNYTGTIVRDVDVHVPVFGTSEGRGFWAGRHGPLRGENLCPVLSFPLVSPQADVTEAHVDQRYFRAVWEEVVFDAKPSHDTSRSRVYEARVREYEFPGVPARCQEIEIRLRRPVEPTGEVFPVFTHVRPQPLCGPAHAAAPASGPADQTAPQWKDGRLVRGHFDLPARAFADDLVALEPGLRVLAGGQVGFVPPAEAIGPLPAGTTWRTCLVRIAQPDKIAEVHRAMGLTGPHPFHLELSAGRLRSLDLVARLQAAEAGAAGRVSPGPIGYTLPVFVSGLNPNWTAGLWRPGQDIQVIPVFEGEGIGRLDVSKPGPFFIGHLVHGDAPVLVLSLVRWTADEIVIEVHNPTDQSVSATVQTASAVTDRMAWRRPVTVAPGTSTMVHERRP